MRVTSKLLAGLSAMVLFACDDGGGEISDSAPTDSALTTDMALADVGAVDMDLADDDAAARDAAVPDAARPADMAPPDAAVECSAGEVDCPCGLNDFCELGLTCTEGVCLDVSLCEPGADTCPCDGDACNEGLICANDLCRPAEECAELDCAEHERCHEPEVLGEVPECLGECEDGYVWTGEACAVVAGATCADLDCGDQSRACVEGDPAQCTECLDGFIEEAGACRAAVVCATLDCAAQNRDCADVAGIDSACGACSDGFEEANGACIDPAVVPTCESLGCAGQNRVCDEAGAAPVCAGCLEGFEEENAACVEPAVPACNALDCGAQNRVCDVSGAEPVCGACADGFEDDNGVCVVPPVPNCEPDAVLSILAVCEAAHRTCEIQDGATCAGCIDGWVEDPATGDCVEPVVCDDLDCVVRGRQCDGAPFAACGDCEEGSFPEDENDPNSACLTALTCADIACEEGDFCLEGDVVDDAICSPSPCFEGSAWNGDECIVCDLLCGEAGETGEIWPFTQVDSNNCVCTTLTGFYADVAGNITAQPCDEDGDGWVRLSAKDALESGDETIRDNARCQLREIDRFELENELGQALTIKSCEAGLTTDEAACETLAIGLYETVRNDDRLDLSRDFDVPDYENVGVGRALRPAEVNSLTKACVSTNADHNDNGVSDLDEYQQMVTPNGLDPALAPFVEMSFFVELHQGAYRAPEGDEAYGKYVIAERSRCSDAFSLGYEDTEGTYWRDCTRNRDADYNHDPSVMTPTGFDYARFSCDATSGTCDTPPPVTDVGDPDEIIPHGLCEVPAPADGIWRGMGHHSQFRCAVVTNEAEAANPRALAPQEVLASELYNGAQDTRAWQMNVCHVACAAADPACEAECDDQGVCGASTEVPGGLDNPSHPVIDCETVLQTAADDGVAVGTVGFVSSRYQNSAQYSRGCINEWSPGSADEPWKTLCPGYAASPFTAVGDSSSGNFGRLICGCGYHSGGDACALGCPEMLALDADGNTIDVGPLHIGGDSENADCDGGYCPNNPDSIDGGRLGWWLCGQPSTTTHHDTDAVYPHALTTGDWVLRAGIPAHGFTGSSCESDDCLEGWSVSPTQAGDISR